jgi:hypothetical protein
MTHPDTIRLSDQPRPELLRAAGWAVASTAGHYAVAWRGHAEAVFVWRNGEWAPVESRLPGRAA